MATRPGINQTFAEGNFSTDERVIIRRLSRHFYITRAADSIQVGNSSYRSFLMRPADTVSVALNVEREIVVLFADYENFEARTLTAFDRTCDQFDDVRVDRSLRFLVSRDKNITNVIRHYLLQDPEYPIVIPFRYSDFTRPTDDFIMDAIRSNYLVRDLFGYQTPLRQEHFFFGRKRLLDDVIDRHRSGQNSGLFGLRKSGKTSTIYAIQRRAKVAGCQSVLIDCQDPAVHARPFGSLLEYIVGEARKTLSLRKVDLRFGNAPHEIADNFRSFMSRTLNEAQSNVLIIFDEIENISPRTAASEHWRSGNDSLFLWQALRSFFQSQTKFRVTFCFVGTNPHLFETPRLSGVDNPVYLFAPKTYIPMLTHNETREMLSRLGFFMGLDFDDTVVSHIHQRFGGHPFFIRQVCSQIHKMTRLERPQRISLKACQTAEQECQSDIKNYLDEILVNLRNFYPDEYDMIGYLANGAVETFNEFASDDLSLIEHLVGYGIIIRRSDDFEFAFDAFAETVKKSIVSVQPATLSLEQKWEEISRRRNRIEGEIRTALYRWSMPFTNNEWQDAVASCLTSKRTNEVGQLTKREAFSRHNSKLYFIEIMKFVERSDSFASSGFTTEAIVSAMGTVNRHRIDAHSKNIGDNEFRATQEALDILESVFLPP